MSQQRYLCKRSPREQPALLLRRVVTIRHTESAHALHRYDMIACTLGLRPKTFLQVVILMRR